VISDTCRRGVSRTNCVVLYKSPADRHGGMCSSHHSQILLLESAHESLSTNVCASLCQSAAPSPCSSLSHHSHTHLSIERISCPPLLLLLATVACHTRVKSVHVTTAWRVLVLRFEQTASVCSGQQRMY